MRSLLQDGTLEPEPRSAARAWLLSPLCPGLGHLYCGRTRRGALILLFAALAAAAAMLLPARVGDWRSAPVLAVAFLRTLLYLYAFAFVDAYLIASEMQDGRAAPRYPDPRLAAALNLMTRGFGYLYLRDLVKGPIALVGLSVVEFLAGRMPAGPAW